MLQGMLKAGVNVPRTSSAGRLFDAVASLLGVRQVMAYEGQAAMLLEAMAGEGAAKPYPFEWRGEVLDWQPMIEDMLRGEDEAGVAAARFHETLVAMMVSAAQRFGVREVCLSGGCFQNRRLLAGAMRQLRAAGFAPFRHREIPPNDAGLSLGQAVVAVEKLRVKD